MRLLELEIHNFRGIKHLLLDIRGKNFVIYGPNGSGKSGVVDAIEFLLVGKISRLSGSGTNGITINKHGSHIDCDPKEASIRAVFKLPEIVEPVELRRTVGDFDKLGCNKDSTPQLDKIINMAQRGHFVLTRRDILKYIVSQAGTRAQEIQELLNILEIENIRKVLVRAKNDLDRKYKAAKFPINEAEGAIKATLQLKTFREDTVLRIINEKRKILGGEPISSVRSSELKARLSLSTVAFDRSISIDTIDADIKTIQKTLKDQIDESTSVGSMDNQLRLSVSRIKSNPYLLRSLSSLELIELGLKLIDEKGSCPLCDKGWPPGKLNDYLIKRLSDAQEAGRIQAEIEDFSDNISKSISVIFSSIQNIKEIAGPIDGLKDEANSLDYWLNDLQSYLEAINNNVLEMYPDERFQPSKINIVFAPENVEAILTKIYSMAKATYPEITPEQNALIILTRLEENLKALERARENIKCIELPFRRAYILLEEYESARNDVLGKLYDDIEGRFVELYKEIHGYDEESFSAVIEPDGAGLNFEVDFYGRGRHPPHALHSEGHQDSMGLCLYLALIERLNLGLIDLIILDDVMMSVDANHRREVCRLFSTYFPNYQFLITTHDKTWAYQMKSEGIVDSKGLIEFYNWHVETGPQVNYEVDLWDQIDIDISKGDIPAAAARLRRGSEQFFSIACEALMAPIICKLNSQWELGELIPAAIKQYRTLLKLAKKSANSWSNKDRVRELKDLEEKAGDIISNSQTERWAVNINVHYNNWVNFSPGDFRPVANAFKDLFSLFICGNCGGIIHISTTDRSISQVRCNCLSINWNLIEKEKG